NHLTFSPLIFPPQSSPTNRNKLSKNKNTVPKVGTRSVGTKKPVPKKFVPKFKDQKNQLMYNLQTIRQKLGLTQQQAADWMQVSRNVIAKYENNLSTLSTGAWIQLIRLSKMVDDLETGEITARHITTDPGVEDPLVSRAADCAYKSELLQIKLTELQTVHEQTQKWIILIHELMLHPKDEQERLWLQWQLGEANLRLSSCGTAAQLILEAKIAALDAVVGLYKKGNNI
ncbi:MAG: helix-turn-helix transcriptional regulator, partial [Ferruginibacter sp.]